MINTLDYLRSMSHDTGQARRCLGKALAALWCCYGSENDELLSIVADYIMEANANYLYWTEWRLVRLIDQESGRESRRRERRS